MDGWRLAPLDHPDALSRGRGREEALALARAGKSVLVLEQHYLPGGWCQTFPLDKYRFSPGVHYVGECGPGGALRRLWEGLGIGSGGGFDCRLASRLRRRWPP